MTNRGCSRQADTPTEKESTGSYSEDMMFVGFDSQNTSHSFPHYPNWNLWVPEIPMFGFRDGSEN